MNPNDQHSIQDRSIDNPALWAVAAQPAIAARPAIAVQRMSPVDIAVQRPLAPVGGGGQGVARIADQHAAQGAAEPKPAASHRMEGPERDQLLLEHLSSVRYIAHRIHERLPQHVELDDLISAGVVGLIDAFNKFDHTKQVQFKSYAQFRIRGAILDSLRILDWSPRELRRKGRAVQEAIQTLTRAHRRTPMEPEIARELQLGLNEYQLLVGQLKGLEIGSLNLEHTDDSGEDQLAYVAGSPEEDPLFRCLKGEMRQRLVDAIEELPEKERMVLTLYYYEELTMKEIGFTLGVVESRVSQIHSAAVLRLRSRLKGMQSPQRLPKSARRMSSRPSDC
jgi:RNA polymerase sigma factor for flagellar operon FliA